MAYAVLVILWVHAVDEPGGADQVVHRRALAPPRLEPANCRDRLLKAPFPGSHSLRRLPTPGTSSPLAEVSAAALLRDLHGYLARRSEEAGAFIA